MGSDPFVEVGWFAFFDTLTQAALRGQKAWRGRATVVPEAGLGWRAAILLMACALIGGAMSMASDDRGGLRYMEGLLTTRRDFADLLKGPNGCHRELRRRR